MEDKIIEDFLKEYAEEALLTHTGKMLVKEAMRAYANQRVRKAAKKAYCVGYIHGAGENGSIIDAMADGKLTDNYNTFVNSEVYAQSLTT